MRYFVNEEGVAALKKLQTQILGSVRDSFSAIKTLQGEYEGNQAALGPHVHSIGRVLEKIYVETASTSESVVSLSDGIGALAVKYQSIIDDDPFGSGAGSGASSGSSGGSSGATSFGGGSFSGNPVSPVGNGDYFVQGNNHEAFMDVWKNSGDYEYESLENPSYETIDPADIEGVRVGESEYNKPEAFWGMHASSKEKWESYASNVKRAQEMYEAGVPIDTILSDPTIGEAAGVHFQGGGQGFPTVIKNEAGFYEFEGNGRHRIIIAREGGYKIPVRVVGTRKRK